METGALNIGAVEVAVRAVGVALPSYRVSQEEALDFFLTHYSLREGTRELFRRVFRGGSIRERRFALQTPEELLHEDLDQTHHRFQKSATDLASRALTEALAKAGASPRDLDFLAVTTCTGSLCPGLSSYVAETVGLRPDVRRADLVGMGCGAALPAMEAASDFLRASGKGLAAVVSSEICSAAILVTGSSPGCPRIVRFTSLHYPAWREGLRFRLQGGRLRNVLSKEVPARSAQALQELLPPLLGPSGLGQGDVAHWILHAGGDKILDAAETSLHLPATALTAARRVLRDFGNMSSPTVLFVLKEILASSPVPGPGVLASFGAGFSAHGALLEF